MTSMSTTDTIRDGAELDVYGARYRLVDHSGRRYRGKKLPQGTFALHRWVATREAFTVRPSFYRSAENIAGNLDA